MKKVWLLLIVALVLSGCGKEMETVSDGIVPPERAQKGEITVALPEDASLTAMASQDGSQVWFCKDYVLMQEVLDSGDLQRTVQAVTGCDPDSLTLVQTQQGHMLRYECVWTAAGETGDQIGRCVILDDGNYHYVLTVMADWDKAGELAEDVWNPLFANFGVQMDG